MQKKEYNAPEIDLIEFDYRDQVVASGNCVSSPHYQGSSGNCWTEAVWNDAH